MVKINQAMCRNILFIGIVFSGIILIVGCNQQQKFTNVTTEDSTKKINVATQVEQSKEAKLVYRVGKSKVNPPYTCNLSVELFEENHAPKKLLEDCEAEVGVIGWLDSNTLLIYSANQKEFQELDIKTKQLRTIKIDIPNTHLDYFTGATEKSPKLITQLVKNEPKLLSEIIKHNWRLVDLRFFDKNILFIIYSLEPNSTGFYIYSFDRTSGELQKKYTQTSIEKIYFLNQQEIVFSQPNRAPPYIDIFIANNDGSNQRKLTDKITNIGFVGENFIGFVYNTPEDYFKFYNATSGQWQTPQYRIGIFDIEKKIIREIPLSGITRRDYQGYTVDLAFSDFSKSNKLAYETHVIGSPSKCALYVLDLKTEKNTMLTNKCFISGVWWTS